MADFCGTLKTLQHLCIGMTFDLHLVYANDVVALLNFFCEVAVVRQKKKAFAVEVEASYWKEALVNAAEITFETRASFRVTEHRDDAFRFIEREIDGRFSGVQELATDFDRVLAPFGLVAEDGDLAIDGDDPFNN